MISSLAAACIHCRVFGVEKIFVAQRILWRAYVSADPRTRVSDPTLNFARGLLLLLWLAFSLLSFSVQEIFGAQTTFFFRGGAHSEGVRKSCYYGYQSKDDTLCWWVFHPLPSIPFWIMYCGFLQLPCTLFSVCLSVFLPFFWGSLLMEVIQGGIIRHKQERCMGHPSLVEAPTA